MIFIYDILINLNNDFFEFYDWEDCDDIKHIRKVPLVKVNNEVIKHIINKTLIINKTFLNNIYKKSEIFSGKQIDCIDYGCVFGSNEKAIYSTFDSNGNIKQVSSIMVGEELEILEILETLMEKEIKYKVIKKESIRNFNTRKETNIINNILSELEKIKSDREKIEYLCYEWFNDKNFSYDKLASSIEKDFSKKHIEFLELLKLVV